MGLVTKRDAYRNNDGEAVLLITVRLPFSVFTREPEKIYYRPFNEAGWYKLDSRDIEHLTELFTQQNPYQTMARLRQLNPDRKPQKFV